MQIDKNCILIFLVILLAWWVLKPSFEGFGADTQEFLPVGVQRYGLRGDPLRSRPYDDFMISPDRQMRLNHSGGVMWESNLAPGDEGVEGCGKVPCPNNTNEFDCKDSCWKCGSGCQAKLRVPDIWPHTS